jgi:2-dehydropantoate 2-reductase
MRHFVLGTGGIGGLIAAALARAGADVTLLMRPATLDRYPGHLTVRSEVLGDFEIEVPAASELNRELDALWVAVKAMHLEAALELALPERVADATVVPLLNGIEHVHLLRRRYRNVAAGAIRVESERGNDWQIRQSSPFLRVDLAGADADALAAELQQAGIETRVRDDEPTLLWEKLAFLAPLALATTALDAPLGDVRGDARYRRAQDEAVAVASAEGARIETEALRALAAAAPHSMRSSMQKDVAAGRPSELDAIAGPILKGGERHGIAVAATRQLADMIKARTSG